MTLLAFAAQNSTAPPAWHTIVGGHSAHSKAVPFGSAVRSVPAWHWQSSALRAPRGAELAGGHSTRSSPAQKLSAGQTTHA